MARRRIVAAGQTARLDIADGGECGEKTVDIHAPEGQTVTVFETMKAESDLLRAHGDPRREGRKGSARADTEYGAGFPPPYGDRAASCAENGQVELVQILLGRGDVYSDGRFELNGTGAGFTAGIGYLGQKRQTIDMNLTVNHWGQKTTCEINASGALKDDAQKIFRGTIDFKNGSADSEGSEQETVLMLGDGRRQQDRAADPLRRGERRRQPWRDHR